MALRFAPAWSVGPVDWNVPDGGSTASLPAGPPQLLCSVEAEGRRLLAAAGTGPLVRLWDADTGVPTGIAAVHAGRVSSLRPVTPGDRWLMASSAGDGDVVVWDPVTGDPVSTRPGRPEEPPVEIVDALPGSPGRGVWPARPALLHLRSARRGWLWDPDRDLTTPAPGGRWVDPEHRLASISGSAGWITVGAVHTSMRRRELQVVVQDGSTGEEWRRAGLDTDPAVVADWSTRDRPVLRHALEVPHAILLITGDVRGDLGCSDLLVWWLVPGRATPLHTLRCTAEDPACSTRPATPPCSWWARPRSGRTTGGRTLGELRLPPPITALAATDGRLFVAHGDGLSAVELTER